MCIESNLLNGISPDNKVYRVFRLNRFFDLIKNNRLTLSKPFLWDDPFENFLSKTIIEIRKNEFISFNITNHFYGQCWTEKNECDGMWRNYASLDDGVIVETKAIDLLNSIIIQNNKYSGISCFLGKVRYLSDNEVKKILSKPGFVNSVVDSSGKESAKTLLLKRNEFKYEKEIRLLYSDYERKNDKDIAEFLIVPQDLFQHITFAPKITIYRYRAYKEFLMNLGFAEESISLSTLYDPLKISISHG